MKTLSTLIAAAAAALTLAATAAPAPHSSTQHDRDVIRFFQHHPRLARSPAGVRALWQVMSHLEREVRTVQTARAARVSACLGSSPSACAWYLDGATQCEVAHEGGFTSVSPDGVYHGRFQMDSSFESATSFGRSMVARYGHAENWPPGAQIDHAYGQWTHRWWNPWPPYFKYGCGAYHGGHYTA